MKALMTLIFLASVSLNASAADKANCDDAMDVIPTYDASKKMFTEIFNFKKKYEHCMDGGIAAGVETVIVESLDKSWKQIGDIEKLNKQDSTFKKFIITNIAPNVTAQEKEVKSIIAKAKKSCPKNMKSFCKELIGSCESSLKAE